MTTRDGLVQRGRLMQAASSGFWTPSLTVVDPEIPYLPLETPAAPPEPPSGGGYLNCALMGLG